MLNTKLIRFAAYSLVVVSFIFTACDSDRDCSEKPDISGIDQAKLDEQVKVIEDYLDSVGVNDYISDPSGVRIEVLEEGKGGIPDVCSSVSLTYTGQVLKDSTLFDYNIGTVFNLSRLNLIRGFYFGLYNMRTEGEYRLYIPSPLAYGTDTIKSASGAVDIPANSNLLFRIRINGISGN